MSSMPRSTTSIASLAWGHARALENLLQQVDCDLAIADQFGDERLILNALQEKGKQIRLVQRTKAETDLAVAAASILARAEFLLRLQRLSQEFHTTLPRVHPLPWNWPDVWS